MIKSILKILVFLVMIAVIAVSLSFTSGKLSNVSCKEVNVVIPEDSPRFIDEEEIEAIVAKTNIIGKQMDSINTENIENQLREITAIKNVEVFRHVESEGADFNGKIIVEVMQREPLFRVISGNSNFYMDEEGVKISGSQKYAAHVLLVTGNVPEDYARESLLPFIQFIENDEFWQAQIKQIYVENDEELVLISLYGDQKIEFGKTDNYAIKFRNLKALYEQEFPVSGWDYYKSISLKYDKQIVCTKK